MKTTDTASGRKKKASQAGIMGVELQRRLPNARIVYFSATPATVVTDLAYADRLGLWGEGTQFANRGEFMSAISSKGVTAMEIVSRELKGRGLYMSRELAWRDPEGRPGMSVEYEQAVHDLTTSQIRIYDQVADAWDIVLDNVEAAIDLTGADDAAARRNFYSSQLRFFNSLIMSMKMPKVIERMKQALDEGMSPVVQLVNTNQAQQDRTLDAREADEEIEDLDFSPKQMLMHYVEKSFPTQLYEDVEDVDGNIRKVAVYRTETDPETGEQKQIPVQDPEAVALKNETLKRLGSIKAPDAPLDQIIDAFGPDAIAEVTGRKERRIPGKWTRSGEAELETGRGDPRIDVEIQQYNDDKRRILVFSGKGGTGTSYHADKRIKNQRRRVHIVIQAGYVANAMKQGEGRTHRSNQSSAPIYVLVTTNLKPELRFTSTIAARMQSMGALGRGERKAGSGMFKPEDNLESREAHTALHQLFADIAANRIDEIPIEQFERDLRLELLDPEVGGLRSNLPTMSRFLNRLMAKRVDRANLYFDHFYQRLAEQIQIARENGTLDQGTENLIGRSIKKVDEQVVYTDPESGAENKMFTVDVTLETQITTFEQIIDYMPAGFVINVQSGRVYAKTVRNNKTDSETGDVTGGFNMRGPRGRHDWVSDEDLNSDKWQDVDTEQAGKTWAKDAAAAPDEYTETHHILAGSALLRIWNVLPPLMQVRRAITDEGESILGPDLTKGQADTIRRDLGVEVQIPKWAREGDPATILERIRSGNGAIRLENSWVIRSSLVSGEKRVEIKGPSEPDNDTLEGMGVKTEFISWRTRYFIPTNKPEVLAKVLKGRTIITAEDKPNASRGGARRGLVELDLLTAPIRAAISAGKWTVKTTGAAAKWLLQTSGSAINFATGRTNLVGEFGSGIKAFVGKVWVAFKKMAAAEFHPMGKRVFEATQAAPRGVILQLTKALKNSRTIQSDFEEVKTRIRKKQAAIIRGVREAYLKDPEADPEVAIAKAMGAMVGEMPKLGVTPLSEILSQEQVKQLLDHWWSHDYTNDEMSPQQQAAIAADLINLILKGEIPYPHVVRHLEVVFGPQFARLLAKHHSTGLRRFRRAVINALSIPKSFKSSMDLSAVFRQGRFVWTTAATYRQDGTQHVFTPVQGGVIPFLHMMRSAVPFAGEYWGRRTDRWIRKMPGHKRRIAHGLDMPSYDPGSSLSEHEEMFQGRLFANIPILRHLQWLTGLRWAERNFQTFLNVQRALFFDFFADRIENQYDPGRITKTEMRNQLLNHAKLTNAATGRGNVDFGDLQTFLNAVAYAPRYAWSQFELPIRTMSTPLTQRGSRFLAAQVLTSQAVYFGALFMLIKGLAEWYDWDDTEFDIRPHSPTFGRIRMGKTSIDMASGMGGAWRRAFQSVLPYGKAYDPTTEKYKEAMRFEDSLVWYIRGKRSPTSAYYFSYREGKNYDGQEMIRWSGDPLGAAKQAGWELFAPITVEQIEEVLEYDEDNAIELMTAEFFGAGVSIYDPGRYKKKKKKKTFKVTPRR